MKINEQNLKVGDILRIGFNLSAPKAKVVRVYSEEDKKLGVCGDIEVIYNQNNSKVVRDDLIQIGDSWDFKTQGVSGAVVGDLNDYPELK